MDSHTRTKSIDIDWSAYNAD